MRRYWGSTNIQLQVYMDLYFINLEYPAHGNRQGCIFLSLRDSLDFIIEFTSEELGITSEEVKQIVEKSILHPNKNVIKYHSCGDGKIIAADYIEGFEFIILQLKPGEIINFS